MAKIQNRLKARKLLSIDKVARRTLKAQKAFDEADEQKRKEEYERNMPSSSSEQTT